MRTFLLSLILSLALFPLLSFGVGNTTDITKPDFRIDLSAMDPVGPSHKSTSSDTSTPTGKAVALFLLNSIAGLLLFVLPIIAGISFIIAGYYYVLS
jgi:hypothetical protein